MIDTNRMIFTDKQLEQIGQEIIDALIFQWDYLVFEILNEAQRELWYELRDEKITKEEFYNKILKSELFLKGLQEAVDIVYGERFNDPNDTIWRCTKDEFYRQVNELTLDFRENWSARFRASMEIYIKDEIKCAAEAGKRSVKIKFEPYCVQNNNNVILGDIITGLKNQGFKIDWLDVNTIKVRWLNERKEQKYE